MQIYSIATMNDCIDVDLEAIRQENEPFLSKLEALAVCAIATNNWDAFYQHLIEFQSEHDLHGVTGIALGQELNDQPI